MHSLSPVPDSRLEGITNGATAIVRNRERTIAIASARGPQARSAENTVLIIGGGIGGLAAAIALRQAGISAVVYERAPVLQEVGAGIGLGANGMYALVKLGVAAAVKAAGSAVERVELRSQDGTVLSALTTGPTERKLGVATTLAHRADLHTALAEWLDVDTIRLGNECVGIGQDNTGVTAQFGTGEEVRGALLVGADGLFSTVRGELWGQHSPRYAGYTSCRGVTVSNPDSLPTGTGFEAWGRGQRFGLFHINSDQMYWYATWNAPAGGTESGRPLKSRLQNLFQDWAAPVPQTLDATPAESLVRTDTCDRPPLAQWGLGRVTLLGDAAHPTTPNLGQGACMAIEDAVVLAQCLSHQSDPVAALRTYESRRRARTANIVRASRRMGWVGQWQNPLACTLRNTALRLAPQWLARNRGDAELRAAVRNIDAEGYS